MRTRHLIRQVDLILGCLLEVALEAVGALEVDLVFLDLGEAVLPALEVDSANNSVVVLAGTILEEGTVGRMGINEVDSANRSLAESVNKIEVNSVNHKTVVDLAGTVL